MNRQIRQLAGGLMFCYVLLFVALNYWQVGRQEELNAKFDNTRAIRREFESPRGPIVTIDGVTVAESVENPEGSQFRYQRVYPTGELFGHITGYYTFAFGSTGVERTENDVLTGGTAQQQIRALPDIVTGRNRDDSGPVRLALRSDLQEVAKEALGDRQGSVVVLEPKTGAIKAMWSYPASTRTSSPTRTSRRRAPSSRSSRTSRAIRCSPTPTSSGTCRARRSRC